MRSTLTIAETLPVRKRLWLCTGLHYGDRCM